MPIKGYADERVVQQKRWEPPAGFRRTFLLSSGKAEARVSYGMDTVDAKVRVYGQIYRGVKGTSDPMTVKYPVKGCSVRIKLSDGRVITARSCCKPPDVFDKHRGLVIAVKRLLKMDKTLVRQDHAIIMSILCPWYFKNEEKGNKNSRVAAMSRKM